MLMANIMRLTYMSMLKACHHQTKYGQRAGGICTVGSPSSSL